MEQGKELKKLANGAVFFEVSSFTGENIVQLFKQIEVRILMEQNADQQDIDLAAS